MKKHFIILLFSVVGITLNAQSPFRIKVVDSKTTEGIAKALVFIEEIPVPDQETDAFGLVTYQNVPQDRKVRVNVRKKGYLPQQVEIVASKEIKVDNNIVIKLEKESTIPQVTIYGEVTDKNNEEVEGASVEVTILGKPYSDVTDPSGNYQIRIDGSKLKSVPSFQIEAKKKGCERAKSTEAVLQSDYINKDIKLNCSNQPTPPPKNTKFTVGDLTFELIACKQLGQTVKCEFIVTSDAKDVDLGIPVNVGTARIIDGETGNEYNPKRVSIGNKTAESGHASGVNGTIISGYPTKIIAEFKDVITPISIISKLEIEIVQSISGGPMSRDKIQFKTIKVTE